MKNALVTMNNEITMSSIQIAELTGKSHVNVIRDIRVQLLTGLYEIPEEKMNQIRFINEIEGL